MMTIKPPECVKNRVLISILAPLSYARELVIPSLDVPLKTLEVSTLSYSTLKLLPLGVNALVNSLFLSYLNTDLLLLGLVLEIKFPFSS